MREAACREGRRAKDNKAVTMCIPRGGVSLVHSMEVRAEWSCREISRDELSPVHPDVENIYQMVSIPDGEWHQ